MIKLIGSIVVIICGCGMGLLFAFDLQKRIDDLGYVKRIMIMLKGEVQYARVPLSEAYYNIGQRTSGIYKEFLLNVSDRIRNLSDVTFGEIWSDEIDKVLRKSRLLEQDINHLKQMGDGLGYLDLEMQQKTIDLCIDGLEYEISKSLKEVEAKTRLFRYLGLMFGLFVVVILL